jgi:hypothetical protein
VIFFFAMLFALCAHREEKCAGEIRKSLIEAKAEKNQ